MLTQHGPICDVCGHYIMPMPDEGVNFFSVAQIPDKELCCHNKCKQAIIDCNGDWEKLPAGPIRKLYEEASVLTPSTPSAETKSETK